MTEQSFLNGRTTSEVREAVIDALKTLRGKDRLTSFSWHQVTEETARVLFYNTTTQYVAVATIWGRLQATQTVRGVVPQLNRGHVGDERMLLGVLWSLVANGVVYVSFATPDRDPVGGTTLSCRIAIEGIHVTPYGEQVIDDADHPLRPGFIERFKARCKVESSDALDEVMARLEDAIACKERDLLRAAVVMVGLAAEETLRTVHTALVRLNEIKKAADIKANARDVLAEVKDAVKSAYKGDDKHTLGMALATLEEIRVPRNDASHPGNKVPNAEYVESLLRSAAYHLPVLWSIPIAKAIEAGFPL